MQKTAGAAETVRDLNREILGEQVRLLFSQALSGFAATLVNGAILVFLLWEVQAPRLLVGWYLLLSIVTLIRYVTVVQYGTHHGLPTNTGRWRNIYMAGAASAGACWGLAGTVLFPLDSVTHQVFIMLIVAGMAAGAAPFLSASYRVYIAYLVPILVPLGIWVLIQGDKLHVLMGLLVFVFLGIMAATGKRLYRLIEESLRLRFGNTDLIDHLASSKVDLELANQALTDEVHERERAERELREGKEFLERIMGSVTNAIFVVDAEGRFLRVNHSVMAIAGYTYEELRGQPFAKLFEEPYLGQINEQFRKVKGAGRTVTNQELELLRKDGQRRTLMVSAAPLLENGKVVAVVGTAEDITERKLLDRMKDEFISTVSHELRTPLTSIRGSLGLVLGGAAGELSEKSREFLTIAERNCDRLVEIINDLLDLQKLEAGETRFTYGVHDLGALVNESIVANEGLAHQYRINYRLARRPDGLNVRVDSDRFQQVMTNLLSNAAKFSPEGSEVDIDILQQGGNARVAVIDQGPGIPEEFRDRVFRKFAQADGSDARQRRGTGLGLSIAKTIVEHMGGEIAFESEVGRGTTFYVDLPIAA